LPEFKIVSENKPAGDQPKAIEQLCDSLKSSNKYQTLLGVTGSGKTFTMANVIQKLQRPALVLSHNKTLSAQLYREFKELFPNNAVEYFVSYYDYYQPEAYVPARDLYIEKDASINEEIDRLRLSATAALMSRRDVIIVSSVSCIYGLGDPDLYKKFALAIHRGQEVTRKSILEQLVKMQYSRNDMDFTRSSFRVRGDVIEVHPAYAKSTIRIEMFGDEIDRISRVEAVSGHLIEEIDHTIIYAAKHFLTTDDRIQTALRNIEAELIEQVNFLKNQGKEIEAHRLDSRTRYDMEMLREMGFCTGIENYSRHLSLREPGSQPSCLLNYFPKDWLLFIDESHVTLPQIRGMYNGDRARKQTLVDFGFRLPSALDNRPLKIDEFEKMINQAVFVSATPGEDEVNRSANVVEQVIRPTGLVDPKIDVRPSEGQIDDLYSEIKKRISNNERVFVITITKKMSEDLTDYLVDMGLRVKYLHSEIETIERVELLRDLRAGDYDVLVGINLLREGIDLPEVSLVAILDADKMGFLRSARSLIQIIGRAARNTNGEVIMYADKVTDAMRQALDETNRRRNIQLEYNKKHNITPRTIKKKISDILERKYQQAEEEQEKEEFDIKEVTKKYNTKLVEDRTEMLKELETLMFDYAEKLDFETAAKIRDEIRKHQKKVVRK
jgi:excinuclease ABC subunit B